jgi:hypothetical protein
MGLPEQNEATKGEPSGLGSFVHPCWGWGQHWCTDDRIPHSAAQTDPRQVLTLAESEFLVDGSILLKCKFLAK